MRIIGMTNIKLKKKYNTAKSFPACHGAMRESCFDIDAPFVWRCSYVTVRFDLKNSFTPTSDDDSGANADTVPNYEAERRAVAPVLNEADVSQSSTPCTCADSSLRPTFAWHGTEKVAA